MAKIHGHEQENLLEVPSRMGNVCFHYHPETMNEASSHLTPGEGRVQLGWDRVIRYMVSNGS